MWESSRAASSPSALPWECEAVWPLWGAIGKPFGEIDTDFMVQHPVLGMYPEEKKMHVHNKACIRMSVAALCLMMIVAHTGDSPAARPRRQEAPRPHSGVLVLTVGCSSSQWGARLQHGKDCVCSSVGEPQKRPIPARSAGRENELAGIQTGKAAAELSADNSLGKILRNRWKTVRNNKWAQ